LAPAAASKKRDVDEVVIELLPSDEGYVGEDRFDAPEHLRRHHLRNSAHLGHRHHHGHHHHHRHHGHQRGFDSLLSEEIMGEPAGSSTTRPAMYPMLHPIVGRELDSMGDKVEDLHDKFQETRSHRDDLEVATERAMLNLKDGSALRHAMAKRKADIFVQHRLQHQLDVEAKRLERQHDSVAQHLGDLMDPQVSEKERQLNEEEAALKKDQARLAKWDEASAEYKKAAIASIESRNKGKEDLEEAHEKALAAEQAERKATEFLEEKQDEVTHTVEAYKYAKARKNAAETRAAETQEDYDHAKRSLERTNEIYLMEKKRLQQALELSQKRLKKREEKVEEALEKDEKDMEKLSEDFKAWQTQQQSHMKQIAKERLATDESFRDFRDSRLDTFKAASEAAARKVEVESGYDDSDWAWGGNSPDAEELSLD